MRCRFTKIIIPRAVVVVAQLVERPLLTTEICGSNHNIGKVLSTNRNLIEKTKIKKKRPGMVHLKKVHYTN